MDSTAVQFLTGSAAGDRAFGLLVVGLFTLTVLIALLLAAGVDAVWERWRFGVLRFITPPRDSPDSPPGSSNPA